MSWASSATATSYQVSHNFNGSWSSVYTGSATSAVINETVTGSYSYEVRAAITPSAALMSRAAGECDHPSRKRTSLSVPSTSTMGNTP